MTTPGKRPFNKSAEISSTFISQLDSNGMANFNDQAVQANWPRLLTNERDVTAQEQNDLLNGQSITQDNDAISAAVSGSTRV